MSFANELKNEFYLRIISDAVNPECEKNILTPLLEPVDKTNLRHQLKWTLRQGKELASTVPYGYYRKLELALEKLFKSESKRFAFDFIFQDNLELMTLFETVMNSDSNQAEETIFFETLEGRDFLEYALRRIKNIKSGRKDFDDVPSKRYSLSEALSCMSFEDDEFNELIFRMAFDIDNNGLEEKIKRIRSSVHTLRYQTIRKLTPNKHGFSMVDQVAAINLVRNLVKHFGEEEARKFIDGLLKPNGMETKDNDSTE